MPPPPELRLAMLGLIEGNYHPYSWSAIVNGYDPDAMARLCPVPTIPEYLGRHPLESVRIEGARVTHVWTDDPADAPKVAEASLVEQVVERPEEVIGEVDAVIVATDDGSDHVRRARPFIEAGLPVFVDKPLATTREELAQFVAWHRGGRVFLSTSGMRYARETRLDAETREGLGELRWVTSFTCKTWERYGIHALEAIAPVLGPGFLEARTWGEDGGDLVHLSHRSGARVTIGAIHDAYGSFGAVHLYGTGGELALRLRDTYHAFRSQLLAFIGMLRSGEPPVAFAETAELMGALIAAAESRERGGGPVAIAPILADCGLAGGL